MHHKFDIDSKKFLYVGSGKAAISLIFRYLALCKNYEPKLDEVFVPKLMGSWVYSQICQVALPSLNFGRDTRVIYIYHQYGIPQKVNELIEIARENNLLVVEDCAHILEGRCCDRVIGEVGDYSIYSISKFIRSGPLGAIQSKDDAFLKYVEKMIDESPRLVDLLLKSLVQVLRLIGVEESHSSPLWGAAYSLHNFSFRPWIGSSKNISNMIRREIRARIEKLNIVRQELGSSDVLEYDIDEEYAAFALPIICDGKLKDLIIREMKKYQYQSKQIYFDVNRNMLHPIYKSGLLIDISSNNDGFCRQVDIISKCL